MLEHPYTLKKLFAVVKSYRKELLLANAIAIIAVIVSIPIPLLMPLLVDEILLMRPAWIVGTVDGLFGGAQSQAFYIFVVLCAVLGLRVIFFALNYYQTKLFTIISKNIAFAIRKRLLDHLSRVAMHAFESFGSGRVQSLLVTDVETIDTFLGVFVSRVIISLLTLIGVGAVLLSIHWPLALFILVLNPIVVLMTSKLAIKVSQLKKEQNSAYEAFQEALNETMEMFVQIRSSNKEHSFFGTVVERAQKMKEYSILFGYKSDGANRLSFLIFLCGFEFFRAASIFVVAYSDLSIGLMLAIFSYLWVMMTPIQDLLNIQYNYHNAQKALERLNAILSLSLEERGVHVRNPFAHTTTNAIEVRGLSFAYDGERNVLEDISLQIPKGAKVAIVGASGSGKTTLAQLLVGLYTPDEGDILFDGVSMKEIGLEVVREHLFLVLQHPQLFNATIAQNLLLDPKSEPSKIAHALKIAQLEEFIASLPLGLETPIGKQGIKLSGGQRQRLSIARMVLQEPNIVILDESTSALDVHTESRLFSALEEYLSGKTTVIIAHRLSTIKKADYIYVLDKGRVVEEGTHEALMSQAGHFFDYVTHQERSKP